jgi:hypothetical protein
LSGPEEILTGKKSPGITAEATATSVEVPVPVDEEKVVKGHDDSSEVVKTVSSDSPKTSKLPEHMTHSDEPPGS